MTRQQAPVIANICCSPPDLPGRGIYSTGFQVNPQLLQGREHHIEWVHNAQIETQSVQQCALSQEDRFHDWAKNCILLSGIAWGA